jgi:hypothetical protein
LQQHPQQAEMTAAWPSLGRPESTLVVLVLCCSLCSDFGFDPLGLLDPVNSGGFITPQWLQYSEVMRAGKGLQVVL